MSVELNSTATDFQPQFAQLINSTSLLLLVAEVDGHPLVHCTHIVRLLRPMNHISWSTYGLSTLFCFYCVRGYHMGIATHAACPFCILIFPTELRTSNFTFFFSPLEQILHKQKHKTDRGKGGRKKKIIVKRVDLVRLWACQLALWWTLDKDVGELLLRVQNWGRTRKSSFMKWIIHNIFVFSTQTQIKWYVTVDNWVYFHQDFAPHIV